MMNVRRFDLAAVLIGIILGGYRAARAQAACDPNGYRTVSRSWDAVLARGWELRQQCAHPERPLRMVATSSSQEHTRNTFSSFGVKSAAREQGVLLVRAGDAVRLWMRDENVRIEMTGVVERSAHRGEHVDVQVTRQDDETGLTLQRIPGIVCGPEEVEMDQ